MYKRQVDIVAEGYDAGVRAIGSVPQDMVALPLGLDETFIVVAAPAYWAANGVPRVPADLLRHECLTYRMPSGARTMWDFEQHGEELVIDPPGRLVLGTPKLSILAAKAGRGVAYVVERSIADELASGALVQALADWTPAYPGVALYYPRQRLHSAGLAAFIAHLRAATR